MGAGPLSQDYLNTLIAYQAWTGRRLLAAAAKLSPEQLASGALSAGSVFDTLLHVLDVSYSWRRVTEGQHDGRWIWEAFPVEDLASLQAVWHAEDARLAAYLGSLDPEDLDRVVEKANWPGHQFRVWQIVVHIVNHQVEHANEIGWTLTQRGQSPGSIDFIAYLDDSRDGSYG